MRTLFRSMPKVNILLIRLAILFFLPLFVCAVEFKVATYNVQNLFDDVKSGNEYDEYIPGKHNWTSRMVDIKLNRIAEVICDLDAEIVALQEIENEAILIRLQKRLKRVGCPYRHYAITRKKPKTIHSAILSKYPIVNEREILVNYSPYDRNILEATVRIDRHPLTLFVNHWKAKSRSGTESRRIHYAKALEKRISAFHKEKEYLILGDMNSHYDEYRVMNKRLDDSNGKTGINHALRSIKNGEMLTEKDILARDNGEHYNLWMERSPAQRWSHKYYGRKGAIDHIMLPRTLFDGKGIDYINNSFSVFKAPYLFTKKGWINEWAYNNSKHKGKGYSDHLPVYAHFSTEPYQVQKLKTVTVQKIENLYSVKELEHPVRLEGCSVILKRGDSAVIKQSPEGMAIYLYGAARGLKQGERYDLTVSEIGSYQGLKEVMRIDHIKRVDQVPLHRYYLSESLLESKNPLLQNQIFVNLEGVYRNGKLVIGGKRIPVYFKKKRLKPKEGSRLKILYVHLGYYRKPQLVIYGQNDFKVEK